MTIYKAAEDLVKKLDEINAHPSFKGVWTFAWTHGFRYDGPTFDSELEALRKALAIHET